MTDQASEIQYQRAVMMSQEASNEALRMERDELAQRVSELSTAIEILREKVEHLNDSADSLMAELTASKHENAKLTERIVRIREMFDL